MASPNVAVRLLFEPLRSLAFGSISGVYAGIGTALANPCRIIYITNNTNALLTFSLDGITDNFVVLAYTNLIIDIMANHATVGGSLSIAQGTRFYVKGAPSNNAVYLSACYGSNS